MVLGRWGGCSRDCVVKLGWEVKGTAGQGSGRSQEAKRGVCGPSLESDALTVGICAMSMMGKEAWAPRRNTESQFVAFEQLPCAGLCSKWFKCINKRRVMKS